MTSWKYGEEKCGIINNFGRDICSETAKKMEG
jgi:hypothetical protein